MSRGVRRCSGLAASLLALWSCTAQLAAAQADSMGQGEAAINVRSDVKLGIKGTGGTPSERLAKLGQAVGDQMPDIRTCYRKLVATAPELSGAMQFKLALTDGPKPAVEVSEVNPRGADELVKCVSKVLRSAPYKDVGRPAAALVSLEFDNSRAKGQLAMNAKQAELSRSAVQDAAGGGKRASWSTQSGEIRFDVSTEAGTPTEAVELVMRAFHDGYAAFLDCRRKCEKGGVSPEGTIDADLQLERNARAKWKLGAITVAHERAPTCGSRAFGRLKFDKPAAALRAHVSVYFAP